MCATESSRVPEEADEVSERLWAALRRGEPEARSRLVDAHASLVRTFAAELYARRPDGVVDFGDYLHYGMVGLLEAIDRYDPDRGASFATFARYRIRGAILNGIAKETEQREFRSYQARLRHERLRSFDPEGRDASGDPFRELVDVTIALSLGYLLETVNEENQAASQSRANPYSRCAIGEVRRILAEAVVELPDREQFIIRQHYFHQMSFRDIAQVMRITKGRVSQLHTRALASLRAAYEASRPFEELY